MALFGVVPDYGVVSDYDPRDKCMTEGPTWGAWRLHCECRPGPRGDELPSYS